MNIKKRSQALLLSASFSALLAAGPSFAAEEYDVVILNGRVMDPETQFDAVRNVGIRDGRIATITDATIEGRQSIDAGGLVVAPGFIDLEQHGLGPWGIKVNLRDGVTTQMDFEIGAANIALLHTLAQLSYWSAKHLGDTGLKAMQERGRLQQGMVADITIFDPDTVIEHATFKSGTAGLASTGIPTVLVNGTVVVEDSKVLKGVNPGQPIRFPVEAKGRFEPVSGKAWLKTYTIKTNPAAIDIDDSSINPAVEVERRSHPDGSNPQSRAVPQRSMPATEPSANLQSW